MKNITIIELKNKNEALFSMNYKFSSIFISFSVLILILSTIASLSSCGTTSEIAPDWLADYRTVYPDTEYIAQRGRADTELTAKTEAVAQIARYFQTSVNANLKTSIQSVTNGGTVSETTSVVNDVDVMSQVDLFAVECTDPYFNRKENKWYCVAFIEREKAWTQYKPTVDGAKSEFHAMKKNADDETDPFTKCAAYGKAWKSGRQFLEKLEYARILNAKKEAEYAGDRNAVSEIPGKISAGREQCTAYLSVTGDYGNTVSSALSRTLSNNGFKIAKSADGANYTANAIVESNAAGDDPIAVYPSLDLKITGRGGKTVFAHQCKVEQKTLGYTLESAQKKAYPILAKEADRAISAELNQYK